MQIRVREDAGPVQGEGCPGSALFGGLSKGGKCSATAVTITI